MRVALLDGLLHGAPLALPLAALAILAALFRHVTHVLRVRRAGGQGGRGAGNREGCWKERRGEQTGDTM